LHAAAGATGEGGLLLEDHRHHLAWAFASGRRANGSRRPPHAVSKSPFPGVIPLAVDGNPRMRHDVLT
jgi:hypothetical protein